MWAPVSAINRLEVGAGVGCAGSSTRPDTRPGTDDVDELGEQHMSGRDTVLCGLHPVVPTEGVEQGFLDDVAGEQRQPHRSASWRAMVVLPVAGGPDRTTTVGTG